MRRFLPSLLIGLVLVTVTGTGTAASVADYLRDADRFVADGRYADAESTLSLAVRDARGDDLAEVRFRLAALKQNADDARRMYERIIDGDPDGEWARRAQLELAKIEYALGEYAAAYNRLNGSHACDVADEACLFEGLSAIMLERFDAAREPLASIRRGGLRTWASISMAEADAGMQRRDEACERYRSLASARISPTAMYRYGECLEKAGRVDAARSEYRDLMRLFGQTPEAVLAREKLELLAESVAPPEEAAPEDRSHEAGQEVLESGFTVQFGSFRDRGNAIKLAARIKREFPGVRVDTELVRYREHHRVRYGYFRTREEAEETGRRISRAVNEDYQVMTLP